METSKTLEGGTSEFEGTAKIIREKLNEVRYVTAAADRAHVEAAPDSSIQIESHQLISD